MPQREHSLGDVRAALFKGIKERVIEYAQEVRTLREMELRKNEKTRCPKCGMAGSLCKCMAKNASSMKPQNDQGRLPTQPQIKSEEMPLEQKERTIFAKSRCIPAPGSGGQKKKGMSLSKAAVTPNMGPKSPSEKTTAPTPKAGSPALPAAAPKPPKAAVPGGAQAVIKTEPSPLMALRQRAFGNKTAGVAPASAPAQSDLFANNKGRA